MSDWEYADAFAAMREAGRARRIINTSASAKILREHKVKFETKNDGYHLIVRHGGEIADFWPSTGKYNVRGKPGYRRGVFNLMKELGVSTHLVRDQFPPPKETPTP